MSVVEIQIAGFGGQGVVLAGMTIGRALALYEGYHVSLTQSFGPEARGGACSVQLIVSREPVLYPYMTKPEILVALSEEAYRRFAPHLRDGGTLVIEEELVKPEHLPESAVVYRVPATRLAEELKRRMVMNMVVVGFFTAVTGLLKLESAQRAVAESVPPGTEALNLQALDRGYRHGVQQAEDLHVALHTT